MPLPAAWAGLGNDMSDLQVLSNEQLESILVAANDAYRNTDAPVMTDEAYDQHIRELKSRNPEHPLLRKVEPEADFGAGKVRHKRPMLSTDKTYSDDELARWVRRIEAAADDLGIDKPVAILATAKLDGIAGRLENNVLASRGDGTTGNDISHMISKGLVVTGEGDGELVMPQAYFDENLAEDFKHPRNVVAGAVNADNLKPAALQSLEDGAIRFVAYSTLPSWFTTTQTLIEEMDSIREMIVGGCEYPTDGLILSVQDELVRDAMGATGHHHNWMLAAKTVSETAEVSVRGIQWQVGRTGRLTPVINIEPVDLSGAIISNVTAHHAGSVKASGLGEGAVIEVTRAGEVIPFIVQVVKPIADVMLPTHCPCCETELAMAGDFLVCNNATCEDRLKARFKHFFHILGTIDLFGPVACEKLVKAGITSIREVFETTVQQFKGMGFGPGQSSNLVNELADALDKPVDDYLVLASLGVEHLGRGDSKKILKHYPLAEVPNLTAEQIEAIPGFGELTSKAINNQLPEVAEDLKFLVKELSRIIATPAKSEAVESPITGKFIVFTGTMTQGSRSDMIKHAESLGATSQSGVNKKTNYLVAGEKTGASKIDKANKLGTQVLSESDYLALIASER
jgi:DNA ligase (NAD+)